MTKVDFKYWIIVDDLRKGPFNHDEIAEMHLDGDTPVWRDGLNNWIAIKDLEDFGALYNVMIPPVPDGDSEVSDGNEIPVPPVPDDVSCNDNVSPSKNPMPQTYLPWAIVTMLFCCLIPGIVTLIYSFKVSSRYFTGDYVGARKASEMAEMWLIITIVCGLIAAPFQFLFMLL